MRLDAVAAAATGGADGRPNAHPYCCSFTADFIPSRFRFFDRDSWLCGEEVHMKKDTEIPALKELHIYIYIVSWEENQKKSAVFFSHGLVVVGLPECITSCPFQYC